MGTEQLVGTIEQVEQHGSDPKASGDPDPWSDVTTEFAALGGHLKDTYRRVADDDGPSDEELKDAFATLSSAWNRIARSFSAAMEDPETRQRIKDATGSLATALGATLSQLGEEIKPADDERNEEE